MTNETIDTPDLSLFEFFYSEVQAHLSVLKSGFSTIENSPVRGISTLIDAAHLITAGALIVELESAAKIAQAIKDCLINVQKKSITLQPENIDTLLNSLNTIEYISKIAARKADTDQVEMNEHGLINNIQEISSLKPRIETVDRKTDKIKPEQKADSEKTAKRETSVPVSTQESKPQTGETKTEKTRFTVEDMGMLELFLTEVQTHTEALSHGLLELENHPGAKDQLEAMMRAAHSIKGGARVVKLNVAVDIAHIMEDCFVAAQKDKICLQSDHIDVLLKGVDMLIQIAGIVSQEKVKWPANFDYELENLTAAINAIISGKPLRHTKPPEIEPKSEKIVQPVQKQASIPDSTEKIPKLPNLYKTDKKAPETPKQGTCKKDRAVRVTAGKIERLIGLSGEVAVSSNWLPVFFESLMELKRNQRYLFNQIEKYREKIGKELSEQRQKDIIKIRETIKQDGLILADKLNEIDIFTSNFSTLSDRLYNEVIGVRMRPFADGIKAAPRMVRDISRKLGKKIKLDITGKTTEVDRDILESLDAPLNHLLRNAIDHGIESPEQRISAGKPETGTIKLEATHRSGMLLITISDDGQGINLDSLREKIINKGLASSDMVEQMREPELMDFLFLPGFSTAKTVSEISGRGVGLDVVHNMIHEVGGKVNAVSRPGHGLDFFLELPLTRSVIRTFLVEINQETYAFPSTHIDRCLLLTEKDINIAEDRQFFEFENNNIALINIYDVLEIEQSDNNSNGEQAVVVVSDRKNYYGLTVDKFLGERDLAVRPIDPRLGDVSDINSVAVMLDGSPILIFDVEDIIHSINKILNKDERLRKVDLLHNKLKKKIKRILVVDDSITVRETERKLLENAGYEVDISVDGKEGWNAVRSGDYNLVVSDIDMPRMNGFEFVSLIKNDDKLKSIPVIIVSYKDRKEDRVKGFEVGANYYLTKGSFENDSFINAVIDLIGEAV